MTSLMAVSAVQTYKFKEFTWDNFSTEKFLQEKHFTGGKF